MGKQKKKRNKVYTGVDAAITRPIVTHISAANRNKPAQWWFEHKKTAKPIMIAVVVLAVIIMIIIEVIRIANGVI